MENEKPKVLLPHHEQQSLCSTRLPYRQGRKLTAVKAYSITKESNHLLIFGVPSLNLRQEIKSLFLKFGRLLQFTLTLDHPVEAFTENYHAQYDRVQSARVAKKMLDTKNFYGGSLHVCYAPEFENISETKNKIIQRKNDVLYRLKNLEREDVKKNTKQDESIVKDAKAVKLNMAEENVIYYGNTKKRKVGAKNKNMDINDVKTVRNNKFIGNNSSQPNRIFIGPFNYKERLSEVERNNKYEQNIDVIDCTSVDNETVTNINESLNYKKFGDETVKKIPTKPLNKIKFTLNN